MTSKIPAMKSLKLNVKELQLLDFLLEQAVEGYDDMSDFIDALGFNQESMTELQEYLHQRKKS